MTKLIQGSNYQDLLEHISHTYAAGRAAALQAVNTQLLETYWQVGRQIVEFEQGGKDRAEYGAGLISKLAADLRLRHGKGFSRSNLIYMRLLYLRYPISQMPSDLCPVLLDHYTTTPAGPSASKKARPSTSTRPDPKSKKSGRLS
ncbi:Hypothetical protein HDN1F_27350 [gamma proteobacterium HdN1]|nr:Hypothetical protein HDN1F_27350 [gamma proteobacterium HdN1]